MSSETTTTPKKKKGIIRTEATIPFVIVVAITYGYFHLFFDHNLRSALEFIGYEVVGAEVDIASLETSFWKASFRATGIEITNSEKPEFDAIKIGDVHYSILWDALLRARFVVNEMAVEQIEFNSPRKSPGKVKPPEPPPSKEAKKSADHSQEIAQLKNGALEGVQNEESDNVFGDIAGLMKGDANGNIDASSAFPSKSKLDDFQKSLNAKQEKWNQKLKTLPQGPEIQALGDRLGKVKTSGFKSPAELQKSIQEATAIMQEASTKAKTVQGLSDEFNKDLKEMNDQYKEVNDLINKDVANLNSKFKVPKLDANSLSKSIFMSYMKSYLSKFYQYQVLAEKYLPPGTIEKAMSSKGKSKTATNSENESFTKAHPRKHGVTYEFGRLHDYPIFWVKTLKITSQAGSTKESGNVQGQIDNISSNQNLVGMPTVAHVDGNFPGMKIDGFSFDASFDDRGEKSKLDFTSQVRSYLLEDKKLLDSSDVKVGFKSATGSMNSKGTLVALSDFQFEMTNEFKNIDFNVTANNEMVGNIIKDSFKELPAIHLIAKGQGQLPTPNMSIDSNLGPELEKGFAKQIQKKLDEAKQKVQAAIDQAIGKQKKQVEGQMNSIKDQVNGATKKSTDQLNKEKDQAQAKMGASQKDGGKQALDKLKSSLGL